MSGHERFVEIARRLRAGQGPRILCITVTASLLWYFSGAGGAVAWASLSGACLALEIRTAHRLVHGVKSGGRLGAGLLACLAFGSALWGGAAWMCWATAEISGKIVGVAIATSALWYRATPYFSYRPAWLAAALPLIGAIVAMPVEVLASPPHDIWTAMMVAAGLSVVLTAPLSATGRLFESDTRLREALRAAEDATRANSRMLDVIRREIRAPLKDSIGLLDVLARQDSGLSHRGRIHAAARSGRDLAAALDDVLTFADLESGDASIARAPVSIRQIVETTARTFVSTAEKKGVSLTYKICSGVPEWIEGDAARLSQVFSRLISNAVRFTDTGAIEVLVDHNGSLTDGRLSAFITDSGSGFGESQRVRLFKPFSLDRTAGGEPPPGTGLGLAICQAQIKVLGGQIGAVSEPGVGSRFWFVIPATPTVFHGVPARGEASPEDVSDSRRPLKVLTVEDHPVSQLVLRVLLELAGHEFHQSSDGDEAVDRMQQEAFDIVLMDAQMPRMAGTSAAQIIRSTGGPNARVPIICVTGNAEAEAREIYLASGMTDCVAKPIDAATLFDAMRRVAPVARRTG